jgi:hypothetical protein
LIRMLARAAIRRPDHRQSATASRHRTACNGRAALKKGSPVSELRDGEHTVMGAISAVATANRSQRERHSRQTCPAGQGACRRGSGPFTVSRVFSGRSGGGSRVPPTSAIALNRFAVIL